MNIAGQRRPACVTRLNCEFRGALVTVNRRWPPSVFFLRQKGTGKGRGIAPPVVVWLGVGIAILSCASTAASAGEGASDLPRTPRRISGPAYERPWRKPPGVPVRQRLAVRRDRRIFSARHFSATHRSDRAALPIPERLRRHSS